MSTPRLNQLVFQKGLVRVYQTGFDRFTVDYGPVKAPGAGLSYVEAAHKLGECLFHQAACDGRLDNRRAAEARHQGDKVPYFQDPLTEREQ